MLRYHHKAACAGLAGLVLLSLGASPGQAQYVVTDIGRFDFTDTSGLGARELSGLAHTGLNFIFWTVGDKDALKHTLVLNVDPGTGAITSANLAGVLTLQDPGGGSLPGADREAIAFTDQGYLIANEVGPSLEAYQGGGLQTGAPITPTQPGFEAYASIRPNRGWESLTVFPSNPSTVLTGNEDALTVDGPAAGFTDGAVVRIQAATVDASTSTATAIGQFAYLTDAINGDNPFAGGETSGLVELLALPDNTVLAMERAVGLSGYRIRVYQVHGEGATDISGLSGLDGLTPGPDYTPLAKSLLWEKTFSAVTNSNFEGMAYVPFSSHLILIADNASGPVLPVVGQQWNANDHALYSLTLEPPPDPGCGGNGDCLTADFDEDGFVGIADLNIVLSQWNQVVFPGSGADTNADGFIGIGDLNVVLGNWNAGTPPDAGAIPEPSSALLVGAIGVGLIRSRSLVRRGR